VWTAFYSKLEFVFQHVSLKIDTLGNLPGVLKQHVKLKDNRGALVTVQPIAHHKKSAGLFPRFFYFQF